MNDEQYFIIINDIRYNLNYDADGTIIITNSLNNKIINYSSIQYEKSLDSSIDLANLETTSVKYKIIDKPIIEKKSKNNLSSYIYILIIIIMLILIISGLLILILF